MRRLSAIEAELLELLRCGAMTLKEIEEINPKFVGALGNLKSKGLVNIVRLPNKERKIFVEKPIFTIITPFFFWGETMPNGRRRKQHRPRCPSKEEIEDAYMQGLADKKYTREWLKAIGCSASEIDEVLRKKP